MDVAPLLFSPSAGAAVGVREGLPLDGDGHYTLFHIGAATPVSPSKPSDCDKDVASGGFVFQGKRSAS